MQNYVKTIQLRTKRTTDREKREGEREEDGARIAWSSRGRERCQGEGGDRVRANNVKSHNTTKLSDQEREREKERGTATAAAT